MSGEVAFLEGAAWRALDHGFADALYTLRTTSPFGALSAAEWSVFATQAMAWARGDDALTQSELALLAGLNVRTVRRLALRLEEAGAVAPIRIAGGGVSYRPGPVLAERLRAHARQRDPHLGIRSEAPCSSAEPATPDPDDASEASVSSRSGGSGEDPLSLKKIESKESLPSLKKESPPIAPDALPAPVDTRPLDRDGLRAAACRALAARYQFDQPDRALPMRFAEEDIALVLSVTVQGTWTASELDQAHRDAILGASLHSRTSPPAVRYIWGKQDYFEGNVRKGREKRRESEPVVKPPRKPKPPDDAPATLAELIDIGRLGASLLSGPSPFDTKRAPNTRFFPGAHS